MIPKNQSRRANPRCSDMVGSPRSEERRLVDDRAIQASEERRAFETMRLDPDFPVWMLVSRCSVAMTIVKASRRKIAGPNSVVKHIGRGRRYARSRDAAADLHGTVTAGIAFSPSRYHVDPGKPLFLTVHNCAAPSLVKKCHFQQCLGQRGAGSCPTPRLFARPLKVAALGSRTNGSLSLGDRRSIALGSFRKISFHPQTICATLPMAIFSARFCSDSLQSCGPSLPPFRGQGRHARPIRHQHACRT